jgi:hypothetical protein
LTLLMLLDHTVQCVATNPRWLVNYGVHVFSLVASKVLTSPGLHNRAARGS